MIYSVSIHVALALKGIDYDYKPVHLLQDGGQQVCVIGSKIHSPRDILERLR